MINELSDKELYKQFRECFPKMASFHAAAGRWFNYLDAALAVAEEQNKKLRAMIQEKDDAFREAVNDIPGLRHKEII